MLTLDAHGGMHEPNYAAVHSACGVLAGSMLAVCARYCARRTVRDAAGAWRYGTQQIGGRGAMADQAAAGTPAAPTGTSKPLSCWYARPVSPPSRSSPA